jgi:Uma2 family endonuclease
MGNFGATGSWPGGLSRYIEVMATAPRFLTVEEFDKLYGSESGWEYWYGRAVRKPVPDKLHALLQRILMQLLSAAGYESGGEFDFKARRDWQPRPDVAILPEGDERYPTKLSLVIEIRSKDQTKKLIEKCRNYEQAGVSHIFVLDPAAQAIYTHGKDSCWIVTQPPWQRQPSPLGAVASLIFERYRGAPELYRV